MSNGEPLLRVKDLKVHFPVYGGVLRRVVGRVKAVDGISFDLNEVSQGTQFLRSTSEPTEPSAGEGSHLLGFCFYGIY